jgi:hypothetical protein
MSGTFSCTNSRVRSRRSGAVSQAYSSFVAHRETTSASSLVIIDPFLLSANWVLDAGDATASDLV